MSNAEVGHSNVRTARGSGRDENHSNSIILVAFYRHRDDSETVGLCRDSAWKASELGLPGRLPPLQTDSSEDRGPGLK